MTGDGRRSFRFPQAALDAPPPSVMNFPTKSKSSQSG